MLFKRLAILALLIYAALLTQPSLALEQYPVRVVVMTAFEIGKDSGDKPGEFQTWVERLPLDEVIPFAQGYHALRYNREKQVLGIVTGEGPVRAAASIMALGMDPRFDLTKAYWLMAGIAGVNPNQSSIGSAAWAEWIVDYDLKYEIDRREIPADWEANVTPLTTSRPFPTPRPKASSVAGTSAYHLNPALVDWAYRLTADTLLDDTQRLADKRAGYPDYPNALKPPHVMKGDEISGATWWLGYRLNSFNEKWMRYWTDGQGVFVTSAMEDSGLLQALTFLDGAGRAEFNRVMILRTASNFTAPAKGQSPAELLAEENSGDSASNLSGFRPSLEAAYRVGSRVVIEITDHWDRYQNVPSIKPDSPK